jgi:Porin PorA
MRGIVGLTLTGIGGFLVAFALLMYFYIAPAVVRFPLNELSRTTFTGHDISWFDFNELTELTGVNAKATQSIYGDVEAGSRSTAVWNEFTSVQDVSNSQTITYTTRRSAFNRRTGVLVNCCGSYVGTNAKVRQSGQGYVWPIGTQDKTYEVFDPITLRPEAYRYAGTRTILGMLADEFVERVGNQKFGTETVPGFLVGASSNEVTVPEYVTETNTVWVDPVSGIPLYSIQSQTQSLQYAGSTQLVLFDGSLTETRQSAESAVGVAGSFDLRDRLVQDIGPLASVLAGIALVGLGVFLTKTSRRGALPEGRSPEESGYSSEVPEAARAPGLPEAGYPPGLPGGDYPLRLPEGDYAPGLSQAACAPRWPEMGYAPERPEKGYARGYSDGPLGPQTDYWPGPAGSQYLGHPEPGYQRRYPESGYPPEPAGNGYQPGYAESGYLPEPAGNGYQPGYPERGYLPEPAGSGYQPGYPESGYQPGYPGSGYLPEPAHPEFPGRMNDGIRRVLEPRPDKPRVGRHGRGRRNRA